jgi:hypothetical protein
MRDRELYATILGLEAPWTVERVEVDLQGAAVHVWLSRAEGAAAECPECRTPRPIYDHAMTSRRDDARQSRGESAPGKRTDSLLTRTRSAPLAVAVRW